jgi:hypothetical protein
MEEREHRLAQRSFVPSAGITTAPTPPTGASSAASTLLIVSQRGLPLVAQLSPANVHDAKLLRPPIQALPV